MVLLDLFSGTGGFPLGFLNAGFLIEKHYFSEIDPHAIANYRYNFPNALYAGPIEKINPKKIPKPDLVTFGFPCQDLSVAGKQKGLSGKRSGLFFQALRLIRELKPSVFIFENVKGLLSTQEGQNFETVLKEIADLGIYDCQWQLLNTAWFLPQNRERIYFVGCLREKGSAQIFPFTESDFLSEKSRKKPRQKSQGIASTITASYSKGVQARGETYVASKYDQFDPNQKGNRSQNERVYKTNFSGPTLTASGSDSCKIYDCKGIRRLTPSECERLQGFPDEWTKYGNYSGEIKELSDTQRYRLMGNAVSVPVVKAIANRFRASAKNNSRKTLASLSGIQTSDHDSRLLKATLIFFSKMGNKQLSGIQKINPEITFNSDRTGKNGKKAPDGIEIRFGNYRPTEEVRKLLKKYNFTFSERQKMWYAWDNGDTRKFIEDFSSQPVEVDDTQYEKQQFWSRVKSLQEYKTFYNKTEFYVKQPQGQLFYNSKKELEQRNDWQQNIKAGKLYFKKFFNKIIGEEIPGPESNEEERTPDPSDQRNPKSQDIAERLRRLGQNLEKKIQSKMNSATSQQRPTPRRARIAASMREDAYNLLVNQDMLYALALAHENNLIKRYPTLEKIRTISELELIQKYPKSHTHPSNLLQQHFNRDQKIFSKLGINNVSEWLDTYKKIHELTFPSGNPSGRLAKRENQQKIKKMEDELVGMKIPGFFPTPVKMIDEMLRFADLTKGKLSILEPSAGKGDILDRVNDLHSDKNYSLHAIEINFRLREILTLKGYNLIGSDILEFKGQQFDRILMNPPFENGIDIDHVRKAYDLLKPGGKLVAIMGNGAFFRESKKDKNFRQWLEDHNGWASETYQDAFKNSFNTTGIVVRIVVMDKQENPEKSVPDDLELLELEAQAELEILQMEAEARKKKKTSENLSGNSRQEQNWKVLDFH